MTFHDAEARLAGKESRDYLDGFDALVVPNYEESCTRSLAFAICHDVGVAIGLGKRVVFVDDGRPFGDMPCETSVAAALKRLAPKVALTHGVQDGSFFADTLEGAGYANTPLNLNATLDLLKKQVDAADVIVTSLDEPVLGRTPFAKYYMTLAHADAKGVKRVVWDKHGACMYKTGEPTPPNVTVISESGELKKCL